MDNEGQALYYCPLKLALLSMFLDIFLTFFRILTHCASTWSYCISSRINDVAMQFENFKLFFIPRNKKKSDKNISFIEEPDSTKKFMDF